MSVVDVGVTHDVALRVNYLAAALRAGLLLAISHPAIVPLIGGHRAMPKQIREATTAPTAAAPGRIQIGFITPGWGSSGYYPPKVLENAATDKVWPAGTQVYFDHPTESEMFDRPERSVRDLAAVTTEDAHWDGAGLVAEAKVIGPYRDLVTDDVFTEAVGMSIRSTAETVQGEAEGRKGTIIAKLVEGISVDLVTKAGRGGKILAVLESSRAEARETLTRETRDLLQRAIGDSGYVVDFDPDESTVVYRREWTTGDQWHSELVRDSYTTDDTAATLGGQPVAVRQTVEYVPVSGPDATTSVVADYAESGRTSVPAPAGQPENTPIPNVQEDTMGTIQVDEAEHGRITEAAGRVPTLESERDTAVQERDTSRTQLAEAYRVIDRAAARDIVRAQAAEAQVAVDDYQVAGIAADYPTKDGRLDEDKLTESAKTAIAKLAEEAGAGTVRGFGSTTGGGEISESDARAILYREQKGA